MSFFSESTNLSWRAGFAAGILVCVMSSWTLRASQPHAMRTWTEAISGRTIEAKFTGIHDDKICLETSEGKRYELAPERLSQADQDYVQQALRDSQEAALQPGSRRAETKAQRKTRGNAVEFNPLGSNLDGSATSQVKEVVVSGTGTDPDKALQNAFSQAIEQTVGLLVDAETVVKNDQLIRDQILTFSRGYVQEFDVLKRWEEGGLQHAQIRATVSLTKLVEELRASKLAVRSIPGEQMVMQAEHEILNEKNAADMLRKTMDEFRLPHLFEVTIVGKPEVIEQDSSHAKVRVSAELSPTSDNWDKLRGQLIQLLRKVSQSHAAYETSPLSRPKPHEPRLFCLSIEQQQTLFSRLDENGTILSILKETSRASGTSVWEAFRISKVLADVVLEAGEREYQVTIALTDSEGNVVKKGNTTKFFGLTNARRYRNTPRAMVSGACFNITGTGVSTICVGALVWRDESMGLAAYSLTLQCEEIIDIPLEDLRRVRNCMAVIEELE